MLVSFVFTDDMKRSRAYLLSCLLVLGASVCGCASLRPTEGVYGGSGVIETANCEARKEKDWDDMSLAEKIGNCAWWPFQWGCMLGGSALSGHGL